MARLNAARLYSENGGAVEKQFSSDREGKGVNRRSFVKKGGAALAGGAVLGPGVLPAEAFAKGASASSRLFPAPGGQESRIQSYRTSGRTGWLVSDIGFGSGPLREANLVRYAYEKGVQYFDAAESYENGGAERAIGEAL